MQLVPSIDIFQEKCVRLQKGKEESMIFYDIKPLDYLKKCAQEGASLVHVVNLEGAWYPEKDHTFILELLKKSPLPLQIGGGIRQLSQAKTYLNAGAAFVVIGTAFLDSFEEFQEEKEKIVIALDVENGFIKTKGWKEQSPWTLNRALNRCVKYGIDKILMTSISCDGMLQGPDLPLYSYVREYYPHLKLYASGGVSSLEDIQYLKKINMSFCILGKALFENKLNFKEILTCQL